MLLSLLGSSDPKIAVISILLTVPAVMLALTVHETAHGYIAYKLGDPTARNLGRLTLNPLKHLDLVGTLAMLIAGYGWAKPVPINTRYFKNPRKGMALTALAGPVSNLILAFVGLILYVTVDRLAFYAQISSIYIYVLEVFLYNFIYLNTVLAVFNLIPIPPFDGSRIFYVFLPEKAYFAIMKYEQYIMIAVIVAFAIGIFDITPIVDIVISGMIKLVGLFI